MPPDETQETFGARFLAAWTDLGGPLGDWTYDELQELKACDREGMVAALRRRSASVPYAAVQRIRRVESPEVLAQEMMKEAPRAENVNLLALLLMT